VPSCVWLVAVAVLSFLPWKYKAFLHTKGEVHLWGHFVVFGVTGLLLFRRRGPISREATRLLGILVFACTIEITQGIIYRLPLEWWDIMTDMFGIAVGVFVSVWRTRRRFME